MPKSACADFRLSLLANWIDRIFKATRNTQAQIAEFGGIEMTEPLIHGDLTESIIGAAMCVLN